jgi:hypothetical protein
MSRPFPFRCLLRDGVWLGLALLLWQLSHRWGAGSIPLILLSLLAGLALTWCGYLAHEWGHFVGALAAGAVVHPATRLRSLFLFRFDVARNSRRQFLWMSAGGFIASAAVVALYALGLSAQHWADRIALTLTAIGMVATLVLELPSAWRVYRGAPMPEGAAFVKGPE